MDDIMKLLANLTIEEKAALVAGTDFMYTNPIPRLGIPSIRMSDGPHGLRVQKEGGDNGVTGSEPATAFPTAATIASSWNPSNTFKMGEAIAKECHHYNVDVLLGPGTNIKKNPLAGRNFEYFSEDPYLAGIMASAEVKGIQSKGIGVSVKHFALNNSENYRFLGDSICDMRAIREIYLKPFEMIVKDSHPETIMCAYNKINGTFCSQNKWLLTDVLRNEWGFNGLVMTDWGATHDRIAMLKAGLDLEMPGDTLICRKWIIDGVKNGTLPKEDLDQAVKNVLTIVKKHQDNQKEEIDFQKHHDLAAEIAIDSAVLLKNDGILPLSTDDNYVVIGELFEKSRYQGSGSSMINPTFMSTPKTAFDEGRVKYVYAKGYKENVLDTNSKSITEEVDLAREALNLAKDYEKIIFFAGLTDYVESEGCDRDNMRIPNNQLNLIDALIKTGKKIIVILYGGSPMELPFADQVNGILNMYLPGQNGGLALKKLLFGEKNPSGKLAETWPIKYEDVPFGDCFGKCEQEIYKESIFVGYRYYLTANQKVRYPFGYGLSYTTFEYTNMNCLADEEKITITCDIKNTGNYAGAEVVELYVKQPDLNVFSPVKELKGFNKVYLEPNEKKQITIIVKKDDLRYWNIKENRFVLNSGKFIFELCSDCETVKLSREEFLYGEEISSPYLAEVEKIYRNANFQAVTKEIFETMSGLKINALPNKRPITIESRFTDMQLSLIGKIIYNAVLSNANKDLKKAKKLPDGTLKENQIKGALFLKRIFESNSIISMSMTAGKRCPYNYANGLVYLANGHIFKGVKCFCSAIKTAPLPKESK